MHLFQSILMSLIQSATEFLPVSSSGHLLLLKGLFGTEEVPILFDIVIHLGSLIAVLLFFRHRISMLARNAWIECRSGKVTGPYIRILLFVALSTAVTMILYLIFKDFIESAFHSPSVLTVTWMVTAVILLITWTIRNKPGTLLEAQTWLFPLLLGLFQGLAIFPGISRSGTTIAAALLLGVRREDAAFYSFLLFIPAILGALVIQLFDVESMAYGIAHTPDLLLSFLVTAVSSYFFLALLTFVIKRNKFWIFGLYTAVMAVISYRIFYL